MDNNAVIIHGFDRRDGVREPLEYGVGVFGKSFEYDVCVRRHDEKK